MSNTPNAAPANPLATAEPWDLVAPAYADELLPLFEMFSRDALRLADLPANPRIADVATGPGTLSLMAAAEGANVSAIDFSESMLAQLRRRAAGMKLTGTLDLRQGDGQKLPFDSEAYDAAFSMFGLIFFPDRIAGFRELRRVLKPGRKAVVAGWAPFEGAFGIVMDAVRANMPGIPFGQGHAPLGKPEDYHREMKEAGYSTVTVETILHSLTAPSAEEFWANVTRTNVGVILARRKLGEVEWGKVAPAILASIKKELGSGPVSVAARRIWGLVCGDLGVGYQYFEFMPALRASGYVG